LSTNSLQGCWLKHKQLIYRLLIQAVLSWCQLAQTINTVMSILPSLSVNAEQMSVCNFAIVQSRYWLQSLTIFPAGVEKMVTDFKDCIVFTWMNKNSQSVYLHIQTPMPGDISVTFVLFLQQILWFTFISTQLPALILIQIAYLLKHSWFYSNLPTGIHYS
jgi:hypothetical protein